MKHLLSIIFLALVCGLAYADSGHWNVFLSYGGEIQDIESADEFIYVQTNNNLYSYNRKDHSITYFSRQNLLSDIEIEFIAWAKGVKKLVVVYKNGNIDLIGKDGRVRENIPDYFLKTSTDDKTINSIYVSGDALLLATNFGIVNIDLRKAEIRETYSLGERFTKAAMDADFVYGLTAAAVVWKGDRRKNLIDAKSWTHTMGGGLPSGWGGVPSGWEGVFASDNDVWDDGDAATVATLLNDDCPKGNVISRLKFVDDRLIVASGGWREGVESAGEAKKAAVCEYSKGEWRHYGEMQSAAEISVNRFVSDIVVDPRNSRRMVLCTSGNGFYEFVDGIQKRHFTDVNTSGLESAIKGNSNYVITSSALFTGGDDLLVLNSYSPRPIVKGNLSNGEFSSILHKDLWMSDNVGHAGLERMIQDRSGGVWFVNNNHTHPALFHYDVESDKVTEYNNFTNQDGSPVSSLYYVHCVAEDMDGNIWAGTDQGPLMLDENLIGNPKDGFIQVKVPRNDGTNFADYLLAGIDVNCIAIDGGGRKWMGTGGNGVYLISADNMEEVEHFTVDNSQLLSNEILDIAINQQTGEVFFATPNGLCSYMADATMPNSEMTKENVWAYPNPVYPDFTGDITICGLTLNARITITTSSGHIVAEGISTGGSFKWNGCDKQGRRVASGVYMVHTATSEGESGVVCKVAIVN